MRQIDTEWQTWIAADATGSSADADVFLRACTSDIKRLDAAIVELEEVWSASPFRLVGPSSLAGGLYDQIADAQYALADLRGDALTAAYADFLRSLDRLDGLLDAWLDAIHALEEALPLIGVGEVSERVVELLESAEAGYAAIEDTHMLDRVRELLAEYGATESVGFGTHELLGEGAHHLPQQVGLGFGELLAQPAQKVHRLLGHCLLLDLLGLVTLEDGAVVISSSRRPPWICSYTTS